MALSKKKIVKKAAKPLKKDSFLTKVKDCVPSKKREALMEEYGLLEPIDSITPLQSQNLSNTPTKKASLKRDRNSLNQKELSETQEVQKKKQKVESPKSTTTSTGEEEKSLIIKTEPIKEGREELSPFKIRSLDTLTSEDMQACERIYGIAKESGKLYKFMIDDFQVMVEKSFAYLSHIKLEDIAQKVSGFSKKAKRGWTAWRAKGNNLFVRNTFKWDEEEETESSVTIEIEESSEDTDEKIMGKGYKYQGGEM